MRCCALCTETTTLRLRRRSGEMIQFHAQRKSIILNPPVSASFRLRCNAASRRTALPAWFLLESRDKAATGTVGLVCTEDEQHTAARKESGTVLLQISRATLLLRTSTLWHPILGFRSSLLRRVQLAAPDAVLIQSRAAQEHSHRVELKSNTKTCAT